MTYKDFRSEILKVRTKKNFKIKNSYTMKTIWRWLKKNKWLNLGQPVTELQLGIIVKKINQYYQKRLLDGFIVKFPHNMGELYLKKNNVAPFFKDNKLIIPNAIDWGTTLKTWYENNEMRNEGKVVRFNTPERYRIKYSKNKALYNNKTFFRFTTSRTLKLMLKERINQGLMPF